MKPPERFPSDDPREWMNRAQSDLIQAKNEVPGVYLENLCFNAQQAAEKAIKAVMVLRGINFPYIHDLTRLMSMLEASGRPFLLRFVAPRHLPAMPYRRGIPVWKSLLPLRSTPKPPPSPKPSSNGLRNAYFDPPRMQASGRSGFSHRGGFQTRGAGEVDSARAPEHTAHVVGTAAVEATDGDTGVRSQYG